MSFLKSRTATPVPPAKPPSVPELLTPPPAFNNLRLPKALPGQEENLIALGKHFDDAALALPVKEGGDGAEKRGLSEREKMFLVRFLSENSNCDSGRRNEAAMLQGRCVL